MFDVVLGGVLSGVLREMFGVVVSEVFRAALGDVFSELCS